MYIYISIQEDLMKRTQIYIDEETYGNLKRESRLRGVSVSELIRESLQQKMSGRVERIIRATEGVSGIWKDRRFDVEEFVRSARRDRKICS
jgi:predicted CopG family antitoxin